MTLKQDVIPKSAPDLSNSIGSVEQEGILIDPGTSKDVSSTLQASSPELWTLDNPDLYLMRTQVIRDGQVIDTYDTEFGFRYLKFDPNTGFSLNGTNMKLKGVCMHHDQGSLGAAAYYRAMERQVETLKAMGCNAIRITHNPADRKLMEICNEKGMLVVEEAYDTWIYPKNGNVNDFSKWFNVPIEAGNTIKGGKPGMTWAEFDLKAFMKRDQNDPCLIMYSLGNEVMEGIPGNVDYSRFPKTAGKLIGWAVETDSTRPVTAGDNKLKGGWPPQAKEMGKQLTAADGLVGFNYTPGSGSNSLDQYHKNYPNWKMYGSETASAVNSRGIYSFRGNKNSPTGYQRTAYDESRVGWGNVASDAWYTVLTRDFMEGEFVWTGFDYLGEPTPWNGTGPGPAAPWPSPKSSYFGMIDTAGFPKDSYYFYQSQWNEHVHTLHILPAWNGNVVYKENGNQVKVVVYSDAPSVELFFTPKGSDTPRSLGRKTFTQKKTPEGYTYQIYEGAGKSATEHENLYLYWMVPYEDGTITAKAYTDESGSTEITGTIGRSSVTTTGAPAKLSASADRDSIVADGQDLSYITVDVTDQNGNLIPDGADRINFTVEGDGQLIGVDNGDASDHDSYQADNRKAFSGKALAIVKSTREAGNFTLTASASGLQSSSVTVTTTQEPGKPGTEGGITGYTLSKNYYVKTGTMPELPAAITARNFDGTDAVLGVTWSPIKEEAIQKTGSFLVKGILEGGIPISVTVNMIENIAALLNYSCAVQTGSRPTLPASRPAVMGDGELLNVQFPVTWDNFDSQSFEKPGMVRINGTSEVFGKEIGVTADVRISDEVITVGTNAAPQAMTLEEDTPKTQQSDTLTAVTDGSAAYLPGSSGETNKSCWTNRKFSQNGGTKSELTFSYATAERLTQAVIYFFEDEDSARVPKQTELYYSKGGTSDNDWIEIPVTAQAGTETNQVTPYTYSFNSPVEAVLFKIVITNSTQTLSSGQKPYTGITEIQLNRAVGSFTLYSDAELGSLEVNGNPVSESALERGSYSTPALFIDTIKAEGKNNAAVTVLPAGKDSEKLIIESEDHTTRTVFQIQLGGEQEQDPNDGSRDYDITKTKATAPSSEEAHGLIPDKAADGDISTFWHTKWGVVTPEENRWIMLELNDAVELDALRYLPKNGSGDGDNNGRMHEYRVEVSENGTNWKPVSTGSWPDESGWKLAVFDEPVTARYVKLYGVHTYGDEAPDKYVNAAEVHVRKALPTIDLKKEAKVTLDSDEIELNQESVPVKPSVSVTVGGVLLRYGLDYTLSYENNTKPGKATVKVEGILKYSGIVPVDFTILEKNSQEISVAGGQITYIDGQPYAGGSSAKLAPGHIVTVSANSPPEGKTFSHWRIIPSATTIADVDQPTATFMVPGNACRLIAMYKSGDGSTGSVTVLSRSLPDDWFAYADEDDLEVVLAEVLTKEDRQNVLNGNRVEVAMTITKSKTRPSLNGSRVKTSGQASPSNALHISQPEASPSNALYTSRSEASPSNALVRTSLKGHSGITPEQASPSNARHDTASPSNADYRIGSPSSARRASSCGDVDYGLIPPSDTEWVPAIDAIEDYNDTDTVGFYIRTALSKTTTTPGGTNTADAAAPSMVRITFQLPKEDRDMVNYAIIPYAQNSDVHPAPAIIPQVSGTVMDFEAAVNGIYELRYQSCHTVTFIDYDGRIISTQRVPQGEAAAAPDNPYREGCSFTGWNKEFNAVTKDMTVKARYEKTGSTTNKDMLNAKIQEIRDRIAGANQWDYTNASWNKLTAALAFAMKANEDESATQNEITQSIQALSSAWNGLRKWPSNESQDDSNSTVTVKKTTDSIPVTPGAWTSGSKGWKYRLSDGSYAANQWAYIRYKGVNEWYRFDPKGDMITKWYKDIDGSLYYLDPNQGIGIGRLFTGWHWITGADGRARCYYFQEVSNGTRGKLLSKTKTPDGYDVDANGQWIVNGMVQTKK